MHTSKNKQLKERKYLYKSFYEISCACNKPIPSLLSWNGLLKWVFNPFIQQALLCYNSVHQCEGESSKIQGSCRALWVQSLKAMSTSLCMCINKGYIRVGNGTTESCTSWWLQVGRSSACASNFSIVTKYEQTHPTLALIVNSFSNLVIHICFNSLTMCWRVSRGNNGF